MNYLFTNFVVVVVVQVDLGFGFSVAARFLIDRGSNLVQHKEDRTRVRKSVFKTWLSNELVLCSCIWRLMIPVSPLEEKGQPHLPHRTVVRRKIHHLYLQKCV